ncbi:hypothetical protein FE392_05925 [Xenorhabdus sp. 12]|uniref:Trimeric autotransporter adhesin YadA-like C-terminal membrane anchor domain-containing protein n=1 Tax=Xenorhabdus santafensis TaxID=2582833 RepID=A0ABU4S7V4_9GAMM|nr:YadA-like family protein [Xenorhabdus sp. 12]MDX7986870.1 hypothetical protein [Xenorhabdus sp. 12]
MRKFLLKKTSLAILINAVFITYSFAGVTEYIESGNIKDSSARIRSEKPTGKDFDAYLKEDANKPVFNEIKLSRQDFESLSSVALGKGTIESLSSYSTVFNASTIGWGGFKSTAMNQSKIGYWSQYSTAFNGSAIGTVNYYSFAANKATIDSNSPYSLAIGYEAKVHGNAEHSLVIGQNATSFRKNGIALGQDATANEENSVAIGKNAKTERMNSVSFGNKTNASLNKQLTNIADGTEAQDAATYGQLKAYVTANNSFFSNKDSDGNVSYYVGTFNSDEKNAVSFGDEAPEKGELAEGKKQLRLINIADGKDAHDAATYGQMKENIFFFSNSNTKIPASYYVGNASFESTEPNVVSFGDKAPKDGKLADDKKQLRLINIADGKDAHDAATYGQLENVEKRLNSSMQDLEDNVQKSEKNAAQSEKNAKKSARDAYNFAEVAAEAADGAIAAKEAAEKSTQEAEGFAKDADKSREKAEGFAKDADKSREKAEGFAKEANESKEAAVDAAREAKKTAIEMDKKINLAAEKASQEKVKEVEEKAEKLDQKVEEKTKEVKKEIKKESDELYKYAQKMEKNANENAENLNKELRAEMNQGFNKLDNKINRVGKRANAGIAGVAAMTNIPYSNTDRFSVGVGLGKYHDGSAIAVGAQAKLTEHVNFRASTSWNNDEGAVMGAGIAIGW